MEAEGPPSDHGGSGRPLGTCEAGVLCHFVQNHDARRVKAGKGNSGTQGVQAAAHRPRVGRCAWLRTETASWFKGKCTKGKRIVTHVTVKAP